MKLRYYQEEALEAIAKGYKEGFLNQLVTMPTATGKTVVFCRIPKWCGIKGTTLVLAHQEDLLLQAKEKWLAANPGSICGIEQAENKLDPSVHYDVIFASMLTLQGNRLKSLVARYNIHLIILDESHHGVTASYEKIFEEIGCKSGIERTYPLLVGFTATPTRMDKKSLSTLFNYHAYDYPLLKAMREGYLSEVRAWRLKTKTDISSLGSYNGDYVLSQLEELINVDDRNSLIIEKWKELGGLESKTLVFCAGVEHAEEMAASFRAAKANNVYCIHSKSDKAEEDIALFKSDGPGSIATNIKKLTEGSDIPDIDFIIFARPTKSAGLFMQMLGRGLRLYPGKKFLKVLDVVDNMKNHRGSVTTPCILGLPANFDLSGDSLLYAKEQLDRLLGKSPEMAAAASKMSKEDVLPTNLKDLQMELERISLIAPDDIKGGASCSTLEWQVDDNEAILRDDTLNSNSYVLRVPENRDEDKEERILRLTRTADGPWMLTVLMPSDEKAELKEKIEKYTKIIYSNPSSPKVGIFRNLLKQTQAKLQQVPMVVKGKATLSHDLDKSLEVVDKKVRETYPWSLKLIDASAPWRNKAPSEKQINMAKKLGIPVLPGIKMGELSRLIDRKMRH